MISGHVALDENISHIVKKIADHWCIQTKNNNIHTSPRNGSVIGHITEAIVPLIWNFGILHLSFMFVNVFWFMTNLSALDAKLRVGYTKKKKNFCKYSIKICVLTHIYFIFNDKFQRFINVFVQKIPFDHCLYKILDINENAVIGFVQNFIQKRVNGCFKWYFCKAAGKFTRTRYFQRDHH